MGRASASCAGRRGGWCRWCGLRAAAGIARTWGSWSAQARVAVEVELSHKSPRRLRAILAGYEQAIASQRIGGGLIYVSDRADVLDAVARAADHVGRAGAALSDAAVGGSAGRGSASDPAARDGASPDPDDAVAIRLIERTRACSRDAVGGLTKAGWRRERCLDGGAGGRVRGGWRVGRRGGVGRPPRTNPRHPRGVPRRRLQAQRTVASPEALRITSPPPRQSNMPAGFIYSLGIKASRRSPAQSPIRAL